MPTDYMGMDNSGLWENKISEGVVEGAGAQLKQGARCRMVIRELESDVA
jgi:hypothetical protein